MSAEFRQLVDRILRCREAEDEAKDATKDVYAEAKANGYDKTVLGKLVAEIRAQAKNPDQIAEREALLDVYWRAWDGADLNGTDHATHAHGREARAKARTSEAMADLKSFSAEAVADGIFTPEQHAENERLADAVAQKYGAGAA